MCVSVFSHKGMNPALITSLVQKYYSETLLRSRSNSLHLPSQSFSFLNYQKILGRVKESKNSSFRGGKQINAGGKVLLISFLCDTYGAKSNRKPLTALKLDFLSSILCSYAWITFRFVNCFVTS